MAYYYNHNIRRNGGQAGRGLQHQERSARGVGRRGARLRNEPGRRAGSRSVADRRLHRRLALQPMDSGQPQVPDGAVDGSPAGGRGEQNGNLLLNIPLPGHGRPDTRSSRSWTSSGHGWRLMAKRSIRHGPGRSMGRARPVVVAVRCNGGPGPQFVPGTRGSPPRETPCTPSRWRGQRRSSS